MTATKLTRCHCVNLRRAAKHVTDYYDRAIEPGGITLSQFSLLRNLDMLGQSNTTTLAERLCLDRTTLVRNLKPLLENGLVADMASKGRRDRMLRLTPEGKNTLETCLPLWEEANGTISAAIGPERSGDFENTLRRLLDV